MGQGRSRTPPENPESAGKGARTRFPALEGHPSASRIQNDAIRDQMPALIRGWWRNPTDLSQTRFNLSYKGIDFTASLMPLACSTPPLTINPKASALVWRSATFLMRASRQPRTMAKVRFRLGIKDSRISHRFATRQRRLLTVEQGCRTQFGHWAASAFQSNHRHALVSAFR